MEKIEIELKFPLKNPDKIIEKLKNISSPKFSYQKDTYYNLPHRDFLKNKPISEWLRIREFNGKVNLNYKNWHNKDNPEAISCDEFETDIEDINAFNKILESLDFKEIIVVEKERNNWKYNNTIISIDKVTGLGYFIEIETDGDFKSISEAKEHLHNILDELDIEVGEQDFKGYPYLMLEKQGYFE